MRFRKRPVEVEAVQWTGDNADEIERFAGDAYETWLPSVDKVAICTLEGEMTASVGDWIIRGVQGEFYPCKPDIFEATYELA
jgi:hypothetical protein